MAALRAVLIVQVKKDVLVDKDWRVFANIRFDSSLLVPRGLMLSGGFDQVLFRQSAIAPLTITLILLGADKFFKAHIT